MPQRRKLRAVIALAVGMGALSSYGVGAGVSSLTVPAQKTTLSPQVGVSNSAADKKPRVERVLQELVKIPVGSPVGLIVMALILGRYRRMFEFEADRAGMDVVQVANIQEDLWRKWLQEELENPTKANIDKMLRPMESSELPKWLEEIIVTHPSCSHRIAASNAYAAQKGYNKPRRSEGELVRS